MNNDKIKRQIKLIRENLNIMIIDFDNICVGELIKFQREIERLCIELQIEENKLSS